MDKFNEWNQLVEEKNPTKFVNKAAKFAKVIF